MQVVERYQIDKNSEYFKEIDALAFASKNLYNKANYYVRKKFIKKGIYLNYYKVQRKLQDSEEYRNLPAKVSQQVLKLLDKNWKSFFKAIKAWSKNPSKFLGKPSLPKYKHKEKGRNILIYTNQAISIVELKEGFIHPSMTNIFIKFHSKKIKKTLKQVRIIPKYNYYIMEVVYEKKENKHKLEKDRIMAIDIGLNNLATITFNKKFKPRIVNGRPLKSLNQFFNKKKALLMSYVGDKGSSNKIAKLTRKRNNKVDNYLHNASRYIVDLAVKKKVCVIIIGKNDNWKQEINIGKKNNQNFVQIPFAKFIQMISYKAKLEGIKVICREEAYTSKCSFLDLEKIRKHKKYKGKRIKRGLFKSRKYGLINADVNGGLNIMRKEFPKLFSDGIEGVVVHPIKINLYKLVA